MIGMNVRFVDKAVEGSARPAWPELKIEECIHLGNGAPPIAVAVIDGGTDSGRPSIALRIDLPDGRTIVAETTARLFCTAARAIMARYPDLFRDDA